jgi:hypothetical protein
LSVLASFSRHHRFGRIWLNDWFIMLVRRVLAVVASTVAFCIIIMPQAPPPPPPAAPATVATLEARVRQGTQQQVDTTPPKKRGHTYADQETAFTESVELQVSLNIIPAGGAISYTLPSILLSSILPFLLAIELISFHSLRSGQGMRLRGLQIKNDGRNRSRDETKFDET